MARRSLSLLLSLGLLAACGGKINPGMGEGADDALELRGAAKRVSAKNWPKVTIDASNIKNLNKFDKSLLDIYCKKNGEWGFNTFKTLPKGFRTKKIAIKPNAGECNAVLYGFKDSEFTIGRQKFSVANNDVKVVLQGPSVSSITFALPNVEKDIKTAISAHFRCISGCKDEYEFPIHDKRPIVNSQLVLKDGLFLRPNGTYSVTLRVDGIGENGNSAQFLGSFKVADIRKGPIVLNSHVPRMVNISVTGLSAFPNSSANLALYLQSSSESPSWRIPVSGDPAMVAIDTAHVGNSASGTFNAFVSVETYRMIDAKCYMFIYGVNIAGTAPGSASLHIPSTPTEIYEMDCGEDTTSPPSPPQAPQGT